MPDRRDWLHEVKHDGYRSIVQRAGTRVRLSTRNGHDMSDRYPLIGGASDPYQLLSGCGEVVLLGVDGISGFGGGPHSRQHNDEVELCAFNLLVSDGDDIRQVPLQCTKRTWRAS
jgi:ATP-dependent DNA ligase